MTLKAARGRSTPVGVSGERTQAKIVLSPLPSFFHPSSYPSFGYRFPQALANARSESPIIVGKNSIIGRRSPCGPFVSWPSVDIHRCNRFVAAVQQSGERQGADPKVVWRGELGLDGEEGERGEGWVARERCATR